MLSRTLNASIIFQLHLIVTVLAAILCFPWNLDLEKTFILVKFLTFLKKVNVSVPTGRQLSATRPDLIVYSWRTKCIFILEVACAWEPLIIVREKEKRVKYSEFARDLATQHRGWKVSVHPLVVGDFASLAGFRDEFWATHLLTKREISFLARNCQFESLCSAVRIIRRRLSIE